MVLRTGQHHEFPSGRITRQGYPILDSVSDYTIYVDTAGDDSAPGTSGDPIKTYLEATRRASGSLLGTGVNVQFGAGTFPLTDISAAAYGSRQKFTSFGKLLIWGTLSVVEAPTIASVLDNVVTFSGSPGWTVDEHVGRFVRWGAYPDALIWSNTADTLTIAITNTGSIPSSGTIDIVERATTITPPATNPIHFNNRIYYGGSIEFMNLDFDGSPSGFWGLIGDPRSDVAFRWCSVRNWDTGILAGGSNSLIGGACWFDNCSESAVSIGSTDSVQLVGDNMFTDCGTGLRGYGGKLSIASQTTVWAKSTSPFWWGRNGCRIVDFSTQGWFDTIAEYAHLEAMSTYERENAPLKVWPGKPQPGKVLVCVDGGCRARLYDSASATMQGTSAYVDLDGTLLTHAEYIADPSIVDDGWNMVSG